MSPRLILASTSPRRIQLLREQGLVFSIEGPHVDEATIRGEPPEKMVRRLAREKADAIIQKLGSGRIPSAVVIGADTTVVEPRRSRVLGKPGDPEDACRMLRAISGKQHLVLTGYALVPVGMPKFKAVTRVVKTRVKIRPLDSREIRKYVATGEPMDKAGAYAAQGIGMGLIEAIHGSYTNVVGLPVAEVMRDLKAVFGIEP